MSSQVSLALFVPLIAKSEKVEDVSKFLEAGSELSKAEEETFQWYGIKYVDHTPPTFAVLDTFRTEEGRKAHLAGKIAEALMANANTLLSSGPEITPVNIVASHFNTPAKIKEACVGVRVILAIKPDKVQAFKDLLISYVSLFEEEPDTLAWYAVELPGTDKFILFDIFTDEAAFKLHMEGKIAAHLISVAKEFFAGPMDLVKFEVVAASVKV